MAKMKSYAVDIEYTVRETIHVAARRPNGAADKALTNEAFLDAHRYDCDANDCYCGPSHLPDGARVVNVRDVS